MKHKYPIFFKAFLFCLFLFNQAFGQLEFIENKGQWPGNFGLRAKLNNGDIWLDKNQVAFVFSDFGQEKTHGNHAHAGNLDNAKHHCYKMEFLGANGRARLKGENAKGSYHNYFSSNDPKKWASKVGLFTKAKTENLFGGIDCEWKEENGNLKYEFVVKPGADPKQIRTRYSGLDGLDLKNGELILKTSLGVVTEQKPFAYQVINKIKVEVPCQFKQFSNNEIGFDFPAGFNPKETLIIDPILVFSSFSGSRSDNWGYTATPGENGATYSGGIAFGPLFPVTTGAFQQGYRGSGTQGSVEYYSTFDVSILKYNATGSQLLYATYLGGSEAEVPSSIVMDHQNNLVILGATSSTNFPVSVNGYDRTFNGGTAVSPFGSGESVVQFRQGSDLFLSKLSADGSQLLGSTFIGGADNDGVMELPDNSANSLVKNYGDCFRGEVLVDSINRIYIASNTRSTNFPVVQSIQATKSSGFDAVSAIFNPQLTSLQFSTFLGGNNNDAAFSIQLGKNGFVYLAGGTASSNFRTTANALKPTYSGSIDGFVCKFSPTLGLASYRGTYLGTSSYDQGYFVQLDRQEKVYVFGQTNGSYPVSANVFANPNSGQFIHCLSNNLDSTKFSTTFGTEDQTTNISPTAFLVDDCGRIYCSGWGGAVNNFGGYVNGNTSGMPVSPDAFISNSDGSDFYILVLERNAASLGFATFFGANNGADHVDGGTSRFDKKGVIHQSVCACGGPGSSFPFTPGVVSEVNRSSSCNNAVFKYDFSLLKARYQPSVFQACAPAAIKFNSESIFAENYIWDFRDGVVRSTTKDTITHLFDSAGTYNVKLIALNTEACPNKDSLERTIIIQKSPKVSGDSISFCTLNDTLSLSGLPLGSFTYSWSPTNFLSAGNVAKPKVIKPDSTIEYTASVTTSLGCKSLAKFMVFNRVLSSKAKADTLKGCKPLTINFENKSYRSKKSTWFWGNGDSTVSNSSNLGFTFQQVGIFKVVLKAENDTACQKTDFDTLLVQVFDIPKLKDTTLYYCQTGAYNINLEPNSGKTFVWSPALGLSDSTLLNPVVLVPIPKVYHLTAKDSNQCQASAEIKIRDGILSSKAKADTLKGCKPLTINFENKSYRSKKSTWFWGNGDSTVSNSSNLGFTFQQVGIFKVVLKAENDTACQKTDFDTLLVQVFDIPKLKDTTLYYCQTGAYNINLEPNSGKTFVWSPALGLSDSTLLNPVVLVPVPKVYQLTAKDSNQCQASAEIKIRDGILSSKAKADTLKGCKPLTINFENKSYRSKKSTWFWGNGDSTVSNSSNLGFTFQQVGIFKVVLKAENDTACQKTDFDTLLVQVFDIPKLKDTTLYYCQTGAYNINLEPNSGKTFVWSPALGLSDSTLLNPVVLVPVPKVYQLTAKDSNQCQASAEIKIRDGILSSKAKADTLKGCKPLTINFENKSYRSKKSTWFWGNGDSTVSNSSNLGFTFQQAGTFKVVLKAENDTACQKTDFDTLLVQVFEKPIFQDTLLRFCESGSKVLRASKNRGISILWSPSTGLNNPNVMEPEFLNPEPRVFSVSILDSNQCKAIAKVDVRDGRLTSTFGAGTFNPCVPATIILNNLSTNPQKSRWIWGSDSIEVLENEIPTIIANTVGPLKIKLKVFNDTTCINFSESEGTIILGGITESPVVVNSFCPGDSVQLSAPKQAGYQYSWPANFKPLASDSSQAKILAIDSTFLRVIIIDSLNCTGYEDFLLIPSKPKANFKTNSLFEICTDKLLYEFKAEQVSSSASYKWQFGESIALSGDNPKFEFKKRGLYPVQLIVNQQNCSDTLVSNVLVNDSALVLEPKFEFVESLLGCNQLPFIQIKNQSIGADKVVWSWDGKSITNEDPEIEIKIPKNFEMNLLVFKGLCSKSLTKSIEVNPIFPPNLLTNNGDGKNDVFEIKHLPQNSKLKIKNRWGEEIFSTDNYQNDWVPKEDFTTGFYYLELPGGKNCSSWLHVEKGK